MNNLAKSTDLLNRITVLAMGVFLFASICNEAYSQTNSKVDRSTVGKGWARNSVNTVIFRKNSLTSDDHTQFIAYYDPEGNLILGKRKIGSKKWQTHPTKFKGNVKDAHNDASIELDGEGYLHVSWDHHNTPLRYARSVSPGSLQLTEELTMIGTNEGVVSYPEFYRLPTGDLLFFYRDGGSGNGNLVINKYNTSTEKWTRLQSNLIDGEGQRNAYWQACVDIQGNIHLSWVWRESPDVASNNDMCYAKSTDGGLTWQQSNSRTYTLPITKSTAEVIQQIPQNSELINQTSMTTNVSGDPFVVSYWRPADSKIPQFQLIYQKEGKWTLENLAFRTESFSLSGMGTKQIPISRPQLLVSPTNQVYIIFRDAERDNKVSIAKNNIPFTEKWSITDYSDEGYDAWEPTLDPWLWKNKQLLSLFLQKSTQVDGEGLSTKKEADVEVLNISFD